MAHPVLLLALLIGLIVFISWIRRAPAATRQRILSRLLVGGGIALLVLLTVTGRIHWLFAALGALIPVVQRIVQATQLFKTVKSAHRTAQGTAQGASGPDAGATSEVQTRFLRMRLHHDSGAMGGEVLEGRFQGRALDTLGLDELVELLMECRARDEQSAAVLETYLDRTHGEAWRERAERDLGGRTEGDAPAGGAMTREEAYEILGLEPGAGREEIIDAHRRLMQKLHPDRGGSNYLAAKLNQAKELLLGA